MADQLSLVLDTDHVTDGEEGGDPDSNCALGLCLSKTVLLGRMVFARSYSLTFMQIHMKKLWQCKGKLKIHQKGFNLFFFTFELESDLQWVLSSVPWSFTNAHLMVKYWPPYLTSEQIDLRKSCIWIQVNGLPLNQLKASNAAKVGSLFAGLLDYEVTKDSIYGSPRYMRVKVEFWVDKPLVTGFTNVVFDKWKPWICFKYEDLPEFCYFCGRLGHSILKCWYKGEDEKNPSYDIPEKGFGPWLKGVIPTNRLYLHDQASVGDKPESSTSVVNAKNKDLNHVPSKSNLIWVPHKKASNLGNAHTGVGGSDTL
ncbi:hypothetical protein Tsubulata_008290 [Turnera subulata]|uniref:CCHC-type domain-containing protein n=1 Tax=Turnera subulata TaxID=218843 RepID=A0A9Q0FX64_9ROSI|nr:hypothetical protein Tsubulata_008290 [Turnera subulata]